jgi:uncharacterized protein YjiK
MESLALVRQTKLHLLLPGCSKRTRLEASGVIRQGDRLFVVFDNLGRIAHLDLSVSPEGDHGWLDGCDGPEGFEDIAYSAERDCFFTLIEAVPTGDGPHRAEVMEFDARFTQRARHQLPFDLPKENKGFEGLAYLRRDDQHYLLALCEGNSCKAGDAGRQPGNGRIQIFRDASGNWEHVECLHVPKTVRFVDFSAIDILQDRVAILSQESAQLWIGTLAASTWGFMDEGVVYHLPLHDSGTPNYCNAEGVAWIGPDQIAITSDRKKRGSRHCSRHDQSIHLFALPAV